MAVKEVMQCDVFGTCKDVMNYSVSVVDAAGEFDTEYKVDLSPKALNRLLRFIERGVTKPSGSDTEQNDK